MTKLKQLIILILVAVAAFSSGRFFGPTKAETKEVEKIVYKERVDINRHVDKKETLLPDGTKITETSTTTKKTSDKSIDQQKEKLTLIENKPNWSAGLYKSQDGYLGTVDRRILGSVFLGVYGRTSANKPNEFGIGLRMEF